LLLELIILLPKFLQRVQDFTLKILGKFFAVISINNLQILFSLKSHFFFLKESPKFPIHFSIQVLKPFHLHHILNQ
jgi:hypothetical protein